MRCCLCLASCRRLCCPQHVQTQPCNNTHPSFPLYLRTFPLLRVSDKMSNSPTLFFFLVEIGAKRPIKLNAAELIQSDHNINYSKDPQEKQTDSFNSSVCRHCLQWKVLLLRRNRLKNNEYFFFLNTIQVCLDFTVKMRTNF